MCSRPSGETANLDGVTVESIDETLHRASPSGWRRRSLASSATKSFVGSKIYGQGFLLTPAHARSLIDTDARYSEVVFPYMGGEDLNQSPTLTAPRWVINFFDWPLERAQGFDQCFEQVKDLVKPEREKNKRKASRTMVGVRRSCWPLRRHLRPRPDASDLQRRKFVTPVFVEARQVFSHAAIVIAYDDDFHF